MLCDCDTVDLHLTIRFLNQDLIFRDRKHVRWRTLERPIISTRRSVVQQGLFDFEPVPCMKTPRTRIGLLSHKLSDNNCVSGECCPKAANVPTAPNHANLNRVVAPCLSVKDQCP